MPVYTEENLDREVLFFIQGHFGKANPVGRWTLVEKIYGSAAGERQTDDNIFDRAIRESKERLRNQGYLICDLMDGNGCYMATNAEEYWEFRTKFGSRISKIAKTLQAMDASAARQFGTVILSMKRNGPEAAAEFETLYQPPLL
jgi:hypothetical protein